MARLMSAFCVPLRRACRNPAKNKAARKSEAKGRIFELWMNTLQNGSPIRIMTGIIMTAAPDVKPFTRLILLSSRQAIHAKNEERRANPNALQDGARRHAESHPSARSRAERARIMREPKKTRFCTVDCKGIITRQTLFRG